jgi:1,4-alpha-glucan branching enzyme
VKRSLALSLLALAALPVLAQSPADSVRITLRAQLPPSSFPVFIPGQFNNWGPNAGGTISIGAASQMDFNNSTGSWNKTYTFRIHDPARTPLGDSVYQYKLNRGGTSGGWYSDPLNPETNPADNNNSVLRLTRLFWFQFFADTADGKIRRLTVGLIHANSDTILSLTLGTAATAAGPITVTDLLGSYDEGLRIMDVTLPVPLEKASYIRLSARTNRGDSIVYTQGGVPVPEFPMPSYAKHGVTLPSPASNDSVTFRLRVPGKAWAVLKVAPVGQDPAAANAVPMRRSPGSDNWWVNLKLSPGTEYEYLYELEGNVRIYDPWGRWNGTRGSRFSTGPEGRTADNYSWNDASFRRPPLNTLVLYELHIGEFTGGFFGLSGGQGTLSHLTTMIPYLDSLGINAVELMPVMDFGGIGKSSFSWGYDVNSTFALEPSYGNPADLKRFVDSSHAHGIAVVLDVVYNHLNGTGPLWQMLPDVVANPYFKANNDLRYNEDGPNPYFNDLDHWTDETQELVYATIRMWIDEYHIDGFRYDYTQGIGWDVNQPTKGVLGWADRIARDYSNGIYQIAEHLPESPALLYYSGLTSGWHNSYRNKVFDEARYGNIPLSEITTLVLGLGAFQGNDTPSSPSTYSDRTEPVNDNVNHDEQSLLFEMTTFQGVPVDVALQRDKLYATLMFTSLGIPMLWEGIEFSAPRGWATSGERMSYRPVEWNYYPTPRGRSHYGYYRALIQLRKTNPALLRGTYSVPYVNLAQKSLVWGFQDTASTAKVIVAANFTGSPQVLTNVGWFSAGTWYDVFSGKPVYFPSTVLDTLRIPAYTALVYSTIRDTLATGVEGTLELPRSFGLEQNYPNPFNPVTTIEFVVPATGDQGPGAGVARLAVYDVLGREVKLLVNERKEPGVHSVRFDASPFPSGVYFCRLTAGAFSATRKMILAR